MSAKIATLVLLETEVITSVHDFTNKVLSCDSLYCVCGHVTKVW